MGKSINNIKYVVGIGASAGGLEAIQQLFDNLPDNTGMSFVIIQHLSPNFKSLMPELLAKHTRMNIYTAENGQVIEPNCIYLNSRNANLIVKDHKFVQQDKSPGKPLNLPIDIFFHSLASEFETKAIAVILSGTGTDGSRGIRSIKEAGGSIMVQDPDSAQFDGMPNTAIATKLADYVLSPSGIASELVDISGKSSIIDEKIVEITDTLEAELNDILEDIYKLTGIDFRQYKRNTLIRRLDKRLVINKIDSIKKYREYLIANPEEKEILKKEFLIGVTSFFRDYEAFQLLSKNVIGELLQNRADDDPLRIWVAGCATGEEAYSIAILLAEYLEEKNIRTDFKIFATDIDIAALKTASIGKYSLNTASDISQDRLDKYFTRAGDSFKIMKKIREKIVFSYHNILRDPPFVKLDLISCRNLLIYLNNISQRQVLVNFQFALKRYGYLFLGSSESLGELQKYFRVINPKWKIFQSISSSRALPGLSSTTEKLSLYDTQNPVLSIKRSHVQDFDNIDYTFYKVISDIYAPSCIIIDDDFMVLFMLGEVKKYLKFSDGIFENNLLNLAPYELSQVIRNSLRRFKSSDDPFTVNKMKFALNDEIIEVTLVFRVIFKEGSDKKFFLIEFKDENVSSKKSEKVIESYDFDNSAKERINELEKELKIVKSELQDVIEELETSNEELQSSNEELLASNEELQSTNEELQSVNEELHTVNSELQDRNEDLYLLNTDMNNLLNSTEIATLFLDKNLNIRKFTPALRKHFNLQETDIGRPISSFTSNFEEDVRQMIISDSQLVLEKSVMLEKEISDLEGNHYLKRISPFITPAKKTDGVVITLTDINNLKKALRELEYRKNLLANVIKYLPGALVFLFDRDLKLLMADGQELKNGLFGSGDFEGKSLQDLFTAEDYKQLFSKYSKAFEKIEKSSFETRIRDKDYFINAIPISNNGSGKENLLVLAVDATEIKKTEAELMKLNQAIYQAPSPIVITNLKGEITYVNPKFQETTGYDSKEIIGKTTRLLKSGLHDNDFYKNLWKTIIKGKTWKGEFYNKKKSGELYWELASISPLVNKNNKITGFVKVAEDVTERKLMEEELQEAKEKAEIANIYKNNFLANMSHEIRTPMNGIIGFSDLLKDTQLSEVEKEKYVRIIHSNSMQLLNLIDDIIDISKIEAGELKIVESECQLNQIMNELKIMYEHEKSFVDKKDLTLELILPDKSETLVIKSDPIRLKQILTNLLSNSIKFTNSGYIRFGYELKEKVIEFFVKDTGIGIAANKLEAIFERFEQSEIEMSKKYGGTGLGLSISKGLVTLLGGSIRVQSEKDQGAEFRFQLPLKRVKNPRVKSKILHHNSSGDHLKNKRVLIVEDDDVIFEFLKIILQPHDVKLQRVSKGAEAIGSFRKGNRYDIILMDIGLPDIDGYTVTREILKIDPAAKVIAQTAYAMQIDIEKSQKAGCLDYVSKPISKELLINKMSSLLTK